MYPYYYSVAFALCIFYDFIYYVSEINIYLHKFYTKIKYIYKKLILYLLKI